MIRNGLGDSVHIVPAGLTDAAGYAAATEALTSSPTALFAVNDMAALGAIAAVQEASLRVPEDVSVVGYDGIAIGGLRNLSLTTVAQPLAEMGERAALRLVHRIEQPDARAQHLTVEPHLVVRGSTAACADPGDRTPARY